MIFTSSTANSFFHHLFFWSENLGCCAHQLCGIINTFHYFLYGSQPVPRLQVDGFGAITKSRSKTCSFDLLHLKKRKKTNPESVYKPCALIPLHEIRPGYILSWLEWEFRLWLSQSITGRSNLGGRDPKTSMLQDVQPTGQPRHPSYWFLLLARVRAQNWKLVRRTGCLYMITRLLYSSSRDVLVWLCCFWSAQLGYTGEGSWLQGASNCLITIQGHLWFSLTATIGLHRICSSMQVMVSWLWFLTLNSVVQPDGLASWSIYSSCCLKAVPKSFKIWVRKKGSVA